MPALHIRPFQFDDLGAAAELLAARHRADRQRLPMLAKAYEQPEECVALLRNTFEQRDCSGAAALAGTRLVGFLLAEKNNPPPTSLVAQWVEPYSIAIGLHAHAVAADVDAIEVYRALYGSVAGQWVERGFFEHRIYVVPGDRATEEAWVNLGFGRRLVCAMRPTSEPVPNVPTESGIEVHQAGSEDLDLVMHLEHMNTVHHFRPPIFWPYLHETMGAAREYQARMLADPTNAAFIAYRDGRPLGMDTFTPPDWLSPLVLGGPTIYLFQGVVEEEARGGGVGKVLLDHAMRWAREQRHEWCALHFASANPSGAPFWLSQGFVPVEYTMGRHVDDRVAWARP